MVVSWNSCVKTLFAKINVNFTMDDIPKQAAQGSWWIRHAYLEIPTFLFGCLLPVNQMIFTNLEGTIFSVLSIFYFMINQVMAW